MPDATECKKMTLKHIVKPQSQTHQAQISIKDALSEPSMEFQERNNPKCAGHKDGQYH